MSDFVNYNKRDVALPWGWTDLIQVLHAKKYSPKVPSGAEEHKEEYAHCEIVKPLAEIQKYVSLALDSKISLCLHITPFAGEKLGFIIQKLSSGVKVSVQVRIHNDAEDRVRRFFESRSFPVPDSSVPTVFNPDLPVYMFCEASLPLDEAQVAKLAGDFFREVCNLNDQSELSFGYSKWGPRD